VTGRREEELGQMLGIIRTCQALNCLPTAGGLVDQPWNFVVMTMMVMGADAERQELEQKKQKAK
jgi:hypothetical protein